MATKSKKTNSKISLWINILMGLFFTIVFVILAVSSIRNQNEGMLQKGYEQMDEAINDLKYRLETENKINQEKVGEALRLFVYFMRQHGQITEEKDSIGRQTTNFVTGESAYERIPKWTIRGKDISAINPIIENIYSLTGTQSAVYQKIPEGYLIAASNFDHSDKQLLTDIFIPNTSDIVPVVENGEIYTGNITILKKQFVTSFFPLFLNSKIGGMISCMKRFSITKQTTDYVKSRTLNESGYLFMINKSADIHIHPEFANAESLNAERMFNKIKTAQNEKSIVTSTFKMPEKDYEVYQKVLYIPSLDTYIGACCPTKELEISPSRKMRLIMVFVFFWLLSIILTIVINMSFIHLFDKIRHFIFQIGEGKVAETPKHRIFSKLEPEEIITMEKYVNNIIENQHNRIDCIEKLKDGDFNSETNIKKGRDYESDLLLGLKEKLSTKESEDLSMKQENEHNDWINKGITKFIEILRFHGQERKVLAYNIISNLVKYVGAIQGAIYFTNEEDPEDVKLELSACYAYERQKLIEQVYSVNDGLLGRAYHERRVINITDLPPGYIKIVSGLGDAQPNNLIIVPLIFNQKISGMLEIASFKIFEDYHVTFLTRIAESIASAISGLKISERTEELLKESQEQSKVMKLQDVKMRHNLEEMRRLKEEAENKDSEMRGLFRAVDATSLVTQYDKDGTILHVNSRVIDTMQLPEEELVGKNHADISNLKPDDKNYRKFWEDLRHGQTRSIVEPINTPTQKVWISETFSPVTDDRGNVLKIINIGMNITETKILEQQLRKQEKEINRQMDKLNEKEKEVAEKQKYIEDRELQMKTFTNAIDSFIIKVEFSRRGIILSANPLFFNVMKLTDQDVLNHDFAEFLHPEFVSTFATSLTILCAGRVQEETFKLTTPGNSVLTKVNLFPAVNSKGDVEKILLLGTIIRA
ncbi:MAG: Cache 3/Cache 2 fusion domain-containing protein [Bacteroidales bacterium]|nr:Cache 3/Cache 2 fusion domain-containing protein [Bacteroidales bacterium]